jgi:hypothetical protein
MVNKFTSDNTKVFYTAGGFFSSAISTVKHNIPYVRRRCHVILKMRAR